MYLESFFSAASCKKRFKKGAARKFLGPSYFVTALLVLLYDETKDMKPSNLGGFQLLDLIITELKSHMTCYNSMPLIG